MNIKTILQSTFALLLAGCGNSGQEAKNSDTSVTKTPPSVSAMQEPAYYNGEFYLLNDSIWTKVASTRSMDASEVRTHLYPLKEVESGFQSIQVERFFTLDSLYKVSKEPAFDVGDIVDIKIRFMDTLFATADYTACIWLLKFESYPACPSSSGTYANLSTFDKSGKIISTAKIGDESGGADAPVYGTTSTQTKVFKDGRIVIETKDIYGGPSETDEEKEEIETTQTLQEGKIDSKGVIHLNAVKEISKDKEIKKYE